MKKYWKRSVCGVIALSLAGCSTPPKKAEIGTVLGGVGGGVLGAQVGGGAGRAAAMFAGAILGAIIGQEIGRSIDATDELRAQQVLETNRTGQPTQWVNPDTGGNFVVTPTRTYQEPSGQYCREYQTEVIVGGERQNAYGTACRQPDGSWKIVK